MDELDLQTVLEVFTDDPPELPEVIASMRASDIDFLYGQRPTPLPDGTLVQPGFRFTGAMEIFGLAARAAAAIDATNGARSRFEMAPVDLKLGDLSILEAHPSSRCRSRF